MDEQTKSIKSIMILNIIIASVVAVVLGLQIFQIATMSNIASLEDLLTKQQEQLDKIEKQQTQTNTLISAERQQQLPAQNQGGTMPTGGIAPQQSGAQKPSGSAGGKCGDGTCDSFEKANPNACPSDCK